MNKKKYEALQSDSYKIKIIGDVMLTKEEESVWKLHPTFCVLENLTRTGLEQEQKAALAKLRMEITKGSEQENMTLVKSKKAKKMKQEIPKYLTQVTRFTIPGKVKWQIYTSAQESPCLNLW